MWVSILSVVFFGNSLSNSLLTLVPTRKPSMIPTMKPSLQTIIQSSPSLLNTTSRSPNVKSNNSDKKRVHYLLSIILPCVLGPLFVLCIYVKYFIPVTKPKYVITCPISPDDPIPVN